MGRRRLSAASPSCYEVITCYIQLSRRENLCSKNNNNLSFPASCSIGKEYYLVVHSVSYVFIIEYIKRKLKIYR